MQKQKVRTLIYIHTMIYDNYSLLFPFLIVLISNSLNEKGVFNFASTVIIPNTKGD